MHPRLDIPGQRDRRGEIRGLHGLHEYSGMLLGFSLFPGRKRSSNTTKAKTEDTDGNTTAHADSLCAMRCASVYATVSLDQGSLSAMGKAY